MIFKGQYYQSLVLISVCSAFYGAELIRLATLLKVAVVFLMERMEDCSNLGLECITQRCLSVFSILY